MKTKSLYYLDKVTRGFEVSIASLLLVVVTIRIIEIVLTLLGYQITLLTMDFERVLSVALALVICVEFIRMLCKHSSETVIDVLLFAIARQIVVYHDKPTDMLIGVVAIAGLFAVKKYLIGLNLTEN